MELTRQSSKFEAQVSGLAAGLAGLVSQPALAASRTNAASTTQRRLTPDQVAELAAEYEAGADMKQLAKRWDVHRTTVAAHLRRAGVALRRQGLSDGQLGEAVQLYDQGWSLQRLAERFDCNAETVRQALQRSAAQLRKPWERPRSGQSAPD